MRYFLGEKEVTYLEWKVWYDNYAKEEKNKLTLWLKRKLNEINRR